MATKNGVELSFSISDKEATTALRELSSNITMMNKELGLTNEVLKSDNASIDDYKNKVSLLSKEKASLSEKIAVANEMLEKAKETYGENSKETQKWQKALLDAETASQKVENQIQDTTKEINNYGKETDNASKKTSIFGEVLKAELLNDVIVGGIKAIGKAVSDIASTLRGATEDSASYADEVLTLSSQTGLATDEIQIMKYQSELLDVSVDTLTGAMAKNIKSMSNGSDAYEELGVKIKDNKGQLKDSTTVFYDSIDALGKVKNETERDALAMQLFGKSAQDLNPLITASKDTLSKLRDEAINSGYVLDDMSLNKLGSVDDSMVRFDNSITTLKNNLITKFAPAISTTVEKINSFLTSDKAKEIIDDIAKAISSLKDKIVDIGKKVIPILINAGKWIIDNKDTILIALAGIGAGLMAFNIYSTVEKMVTAIQGFKKANEAATIAQAALNFVMNLNPIMLIVTAIGVLVGALIALWATNEDFRNAVINIFNAVKDFISGIIDAIVSFFTETIPNAIGTVIDWFKKLPENIGYLIGLVLGFIASFYIRLWDFVTKDIPDFINGIIEWFKKLPSRIWDAIVSGIQKIKDFVGNMIDAIKTELPKFIGKFVEFMKQLPEKMLDIGKNIVKGIWNGISSSIDWLKDKIGDFANGIVKGIKDALKIHSPSVLMQDEVGLNIGLGVANGIEKSISAVKSAMGDLTNSAMTTVTPQLNMNDITNDGINPGQVTPIYLTIDTFNNNREIDIESLMSELEFARQRQAMAGGR
jgi:hypothetical protein